MHSVLVHLSKEELRVERWRHSLTERIHILPYFFWQLVLHITLRHFANSLYKYLATKFLCQFTPLPTISPSGRVANFTLTLPLTSAISKK
jgi:hypothetical protein